MCSFDHLVVSLVFELAKVFDDARSAARFARHTHISTVQYQPVVRIHFEFIGNELEKFILYLANVFAGGDFCPVRDAKDMSVNRDSWMTECGI